MMKFILSLLLVCSSTCLFGNNHQATNSNSAGQTNAPAIKESADTRVPGTISVKMKLTGAFSLSHGNSTLIGGTTGFNWNRNRLWIDEWDFSINGRISREEERVTDRNASAVIRYGRSFSRRFYGFLRFAADHDRNTGVDSRLQPTAGAGFWFSDSKSLKTFTEFGAGGLFVSRSGVADASGWVLQLRLSLIWKPIDNFEFRSDNFFFPPDADLGELRFESKNSILLKIVSKVALSLNYNLVLDKAAAAGSDTLSGFFSTGLEWTL